MKLSLDVGCGEFPKGIVNCDQRRFHYPFFAMADAQFLPFRENTFSEVFSFHLVEHVEKPERVLSELLRVTKVNGVIEIRVPAKLTSKAKGHQHRWRFDYDFFLNFFKKHMIMDLSTTGRFSVTFERRFCMEIICKVRKAY